VRNPYGADVTAGLDGGEVVAVVVGDVVDIGGGVDVGAIVGEADGVTDDETPTVGELVAGATVAEPDGSAGATTGGALVAPPVASRMSNGFRAFGPGWPPP
jgi:hypothetical protein